MATQNDGIRTFTAGEALTQYALVELDSSADSDGIMQVVMTDSDDAAIGVVQDDVAYGGHAPVRLLDKTYKLIAGEAFAAGASLYAGANGVVVDTDPGSGTIRWKALEAASAANAIVECIPVRST